MNLTVREYAKKYRLSIYQVIKKLQNGELKGYTDERDGKKVQYVEVQNSSIEIKNDEDKRAKRVSQSSLATKDDIQALKEEIRLLRVEIERLNIKPQE